MARHLAVTTLFSLLFLLLFSPVPAASMCLATPCYVAEFEVTFCEDSKDGTSTLTGRVAKWRDVECREADARLRGTSDTDFSKEDSWFTSKSHPTRTPDFSTGPFEVFLTTQCDKYTVGEKVTGKLGQECLDTLPRPPQPKGVDHYTFKPFAKP